MDNKMKNKLIIQNIMTINTAKKIVSMKMRGVLAESLEHSHTNDLGIILVHKTTRTKYVVDSNNNVTAYKA